MKRFLALILALTMLAATATLAFANDEVQIRIRDNGGAFTSGSAAVGSTQEFQLAGFDGEYLDYNYHFDMEITGADITLEEYWYTDPESSSTKDWIPVDPRDNIYFLQGGINYRITFNSTGTLFYTIGGNHLEINALRLTPGSYDCYTEGTISVGVSGGGSNDNPSVTDNEANSDETHEAIRNGQGVGVDLHVPAAISLYTMNLLGAHPGSSLTVEVGGYSLYIPGGFGQVNEPGRCYYPVDYHSPSLREKYYPAVPEDIDFETADLAGAMPMPTTVTVTAETDLEGTVYVYLWDEDTDKLTYIAAPTAEDGEITFTTTVLGHFLFTSQEL